MTIENPSALLALIGVAGYVFHLWLGDYRSRAREMRPVSPLPGATETTSRAVAIACAGAFVLLLIEVWGEHRLGISEAQSKITWLFAIYTLFAAFGEELLFRGYVVIEKRGRVVFLSSVIGFSLIFASQDYPAMKKRSEKEADSIIANTNLKVFMKLADSETNELFKKLVGGAIVTETSGFSMEQQQTFMNYYDMRNASVKERSKADFVDLKGLGPGQSYVISNGTMHRTTMFFANPDTASTLRYNKFIPVRSPDLTTFGTGSVETVIQRLADPGFAARDAEPARPTVGEIEAATRLIARAEKVAPGKRACAAVAGVARALGGGGATQSGQAPGFEPDSDSFAVLP